MIRDGRRAICLILDGFGIGSMDGSDGPPNTAGAVARLAGEPALPVLDRLGLAGARAMGGHRRAAGTAAGAAAIRSRIAHPGADTYLGHQEMMGTIPAAPAFAVMAEIGDGLIAALRAQDLQASWADTAAGRVLTAGPAVIADNIEAARGININVTASLDEMSFADLLRIGEVVRAAVKVSRVIVVGGRGYRQADITGHVQRHPQGHVGVNTPELGVYDKHYRVRHLGLPVDTARQAPSLARQAGLPVALLGKAADVVSCPDPAVLDPAVDTGKVFDLAAGALASLPGGLVVMNIQETDLAGHEQDAARYRAVLERVDARLDGILRLLRDGDLLVVTADHGNDPGIGTSQHTREFVPVLVHGAPPGSVQGGTRETLADVGATLCQWLGLPAPQDGTPILAAGGG
jgi:phosphopentomutase